MGSEMCIRDRDWNGIVLVVKPTNSKIANTLGISKPGKYALKVT